MIKGIVKDYYELSCGSGYIYLIYCESPDTRETFLNFLNELPNIKDEILIQKANYNIVSKIEIDSSIPDDVIRLCYGPHTVAKVTLRPEPTTDAPQGMGDSERLEWLAEQKDVQFFFLNGEGWFLQWDFSETKPQKETRTCLSFRAAIDAAIKAEKEAPDA